METNRRTATMAADHGAFNFSEELGFILKHPLTELPEYYHLWMDTAYNLPRLIESHQLQNLVREMPVLSAHLLSGHRQLRLAHLVLGFIATGYVWQEGRRAPADTLPKAVALPFWLVSRRLGLPPILTYADSILANWKLRDPTGDMKIENLDVIFYLPGGESCRGFVLVSLLVELAASSGVKGLLDVMRALDMRDIRGIEKGLHDVTASLHKMKETFKLMHTNVDPTDFHGTLRIFFSGWQDNPLLPAGLLYEGVSEEPMCFSGGSAAQSSAIQCFDALLCIQHDRDPGAYLTRMRDYMLPAHRRLIDTLSAHRPPLREFLLSSAGPASCQAYDSCVSALEDLRSYHLGVVARFVTVPASRARAAACPLGSVVATGTGGSNAMAFLKSIRDSTRKVLILAPGNKT